MEENNTLSGNARILQKLQQGETDIGVAKKVEAVHIVLPVQPDALTILSTPGQLKHIKISNLDSENTADFFEAINKNPHICEVSFFIDNSFADTTQGTLNLQKAKQLIDLIKQFNTICAVNLLPDTFSVTQSLKTFIGLNLLDWRYKSAYDNVLRLEREPQPALSQKRQKVALDPMPPGDEPQRSTLNCS